jgi:hypothetical protein
VCLVPDRHQRENALLKSKLGGGMIRAFASVVALMSVACTSAPIFSVVDPAAHGWSPSRIVVWVALAVSDLALRTAAEHRLRDRVSASVSKL